MREYPLATGKRLDIHITCDTFAVALELKSPREGTTITASHNPLRQLEEYIDQLARLYRDKHVSVILLRTDGKTPRDLLAGGLRENLTPQARQAIHIISRDNIKSMLSTAKRIAKADGEELTAKKLLELIAKGRIDTIRLAVSTEPK